MSIFKQMLWIAVFAVPQHLLAQAYTVTYVKGNVSYAGKQIAIRDRLPGTAKLYSDFRSSELGLIQPKKGRLFLTFKNGKPVEQKSARPKHSELYELTLEDYLLSYGTQGTLGVRDRFDLLSFFTEFMDDSTHLVTLIADQSIPVVSSTLRTEPGDRFYLCIYSGGDTVCNFLKRHGDSLQFRAKDLRLPAGQSANGDLQALMKFGYVNEGQYQERWFPYPFTIRFIPVEEVRMIIAAYLDNQDYYNGDEKSLLKDIHAHFSYYYGNFYKEGLDTLISRMKQP